MKRTIRNLIFLGLIVVICLPKSTPSKENFKIHFAIGIGLSWRDIIGVNLGVIFLERYYLEHYRGMGLFYGGGRSYIFGLNFENEWHGGKIGLGWHRRYTIKRTMYSTKGLMYQTKYQGKFYRDSPFGHFLEYNGGFFKNKPSKENKIKFYPISQLRYGLYFSGL